MAAAERALLIGGLFSILVTVWLWLTLPVADSEWPLTASLAIPRAAEGDASYTLGLATHLSVDKLYFVSEIAGRWDGSLSVAVYFPSRACGKAAPVLEKARTSYRLRETVKLTHWCGDFDNYPINKLRNLAIEQLVTTHFLMVDADLMPSVELMEAFLALPKPVVASPSSAVVVPAFEWTHYDCESTQACFDQYRPMIPTCLEQLQQCIDARNCGVFYAYWAPDTHADTDSSRWLALSKGNADRKGPLQPYSIPCFKHAKYEPYVVLPNLHSTPRYDERFDGYGKNKIQHITHLRYAGFAFHVLPQGFLVHMPHRESKHKEKWQDASSGQQQKMDGLFDQFVAELGRQYQPEDAIALQCA